MAEHPKSAVYRYIAQHVDNPDAIILNVSDVSYDHIYQPLDNKNIFTCIIKCSLNKKRYTITSEKFLTKKDAEKDAFDTLYRMLQKSIRSKDSDDDTDSNDSKQDIKQDSKPTAHTINTNMRSRSKSVESRDSTKCVVSGKKTVSTDCIDISSSSSTGTPASISVPIPIPTSVLKDDDEISMRKQKNRTEWKDDITGTDMTKTIIVIVDFENICKQSDIIKLTNYIKHYMQSQQEFTVRIVKIAGFCSSVKNSADIVVRSNRSDAVDHYISYLVGKLEVSKLPPKKIYIISRDKFGSCLQDFCNNVEHSSDVNDFISVFTQ